MLTLSHNRGTYHYFSYFFLIQILLETSSCTKNIFQMTPSAIYIKTINKTTRAVDVGSPPSAPQNTCIRQKISKHTRAQTSIHLEPLPNDAGRLTDAVVTKFLEYNCNIGQISVLCLM